MYCKNCGKKLPEDARFCDRCNMSVRKKEGKMAQIESLKEERLARKKAGEIEDRLKKIKQVKRRRYTTVIYIIIGVIVVGFASFMISYCTNSEDNAFIKEEEFATQTPQATVAPTNDLDGVYNDDGYIEVTVHNTVFAYPDGFTKKNDDNGKILALHNASDQSEITVSKEITSLTAVKLMDKYRGEIENAKVTESLASESGYSITIESGNTVYHKKSYVTDGAELYYEYIYPADSPDALKHKDAIKYMDARFTVS